MRAALSWAAVAALSAWAPSLSAQERTPIAVMDLAGRGVDEAAAGALTTEVSNTLAGLRLFQVITREDIKRMLQLEQTRQQCTGDADSSCLAEIGGALGVDYLIYGEVSKIAETYSLSLVLLDISQAQAANRINRKVEAPGALLQETEAAAKLLVQPLLAGKKGFLVLQGAETGATVKLDGRLLGASPLPGRLELGMGTHELLIEKEGFLPWARTLDVAPNQVTVESVAMVPSQAYISEYRDQARAIRTAAWVTAGTGAVLLATGVVLRLIGNARFDDLINKGFITQNATICLEQDPAYNGEDYCPTPTGFTNDALGTIDSIETLDTVALVSLVAGAVSALSATVLFLAGENPDRYDAYGETGAAAARLQTFTIGPNGASVTVRW